MGKNKLRRETLHVAPFDYEVTFDPTLGEVTGNAGNTSSTLGVILIDSSQSADMQADTLLHEGLHAGWNQTLLKRSIDPDKEEDIIWQMTPRILAMLRDNPWFTAVILGK